VEALKGDSATQSSFATIEVLLEKNLQSVHYLKQELAYAKQLAALSPEEQVRFYEQKIHPLREAGARLAAEGIEVVNAAKARGVHLPEEMFTDLYSQAQTAP
jgi:hypothetical protein